MNLIAHLQKSLISLIKMLRLILRSFGIRHISNPSAASFKRPWSKAEDELLLKYRQSGLQVPQFASKLPGRTYQSIYYRYHRLQQESLYKKGAWIPAEDEFLIQKMHALEAKENAQIAWTDLGLELGLSPADVRSRWRNVLNPNIKRGIFTPEEKAFMMAEIEKAQESQTNLRMAALAAKMGRAEKRVRAFCWNQLMDYKSGKRTWTREEDLEILNRVKEREGRGEKPYWEELGREFQVSGVMIKRRYRKLMEEEGIK